MKKSTLIIILVFNASIYSQVSENLLMERFNMNAFNPAYAGSEGRVLSFTTRSTWQGVNDAPKMNYFYFSGNHKNNLSFGLSIINNKWASKKFELFLSLFLFIKLIACGILSCKTNE